VSPLDHSPPAQNLPRWFHEFGGFVELPVLSLFLGGWSAFGGVLIALTPLYANPFALIGLMVVFGGCAFVVTTLYSVTTDFEKQCADG
jgi:hypothetical protein